MTNAERIAQEMLNDLLEDTGTESTNEAIDALGSQGIEIDAESDIGHIDGAFHFSRPENRDIAGEFENLVDASC